MPQHIQLASNRDKFRVLDMAQSLKETNQSFNGKAELLPHWTGINTYSDYGFTFAVHRASASTSIWRLTEHLTIVVDPNNIPSNQEPTLLQRRCRSWPRTIGSIGLHIVPTKSCQPNKASEGLLRTQLKCQVGEYTLQEWSAILQDIVHPWNKHLVKSINL